MIQLNGFRLTIGMFDATFDRLEENKPMDDQCRFDGKQFTVFGANLFRPINEILSSGLILS